MLLSQILSGISYDCSGDVNIDVSDIVYDSRKAAPGTLFVALCGAFSDGHDYAEGAYLRGARAFLVQKDVLLPSENEGEYEVAQTGTIHFDEAGLYFLMIAVDEEYPDSDPVYYTVQAAW